MSFRLGVVGASGRMGQEVAKAAGLNSQFVPALGITPGEKAPGFSLTKKLSEVSTADQLQGLIDFSEPGAMAAAADLATRLKIPLVSGTTGLSEEQLGLLKKAGQQTAVFWSPNMSVGVALLIRALKAIQPPPGYDIHLNEVHHRHKKDSPSGTALLIQSRVETAWKRKIPTPTSVRGGGDFGTHTLSIMGPSETLVFAHQALNRAVFAEGALMVMDWLKHQPAGFYQFEDFFKQTGENQ